MRQSIICWQFLFYLTVKDILSYLIFCKKNDKNWFIICFTNTNYHQELIKKIFMGFFPFFQEYPCAYIICTISVFVIGISAYPFDFSDRECQDLFPQRLGGDARVHSHNAPFTVEPQDSIFTDSGLKGKTIVMIVAIFLCHRRSPV